MTAKGESVANLADVVGTAAGIVLDKAQLPVVPTFCVLSGAPWSVVGCSGWGAGAGGRGGGGSRCSGQFFVAF